MRLRITIFLSLLLSFSLFATEYQVDPNHTSVNFNVKHFAISNIYGRFNQFSGDFKWDEKNPAKSKIHFEIQAKSIDTNQMQRDEHLRTKDFFEVETYPKMIFTSTSIKKIKKGKYKVSGNFNLHGVTKPLHFDLIISKEITDTFKKQRRGFAADFTLNRSDYGMKTLLGPVGDKINIQIHGELLKK